VSVPRTGDVSVSCGSGCSLEVKEDDRIPMKIMLINHYAGSTVHRMEYRPFFLARE